MLVLSRKLKQSIEIAEGLIEIEVVSIKGSYVKLAIKAPKDIDIVRKELKRDEN